MKNLKRCFHRAITAVMLAATLAVGMNPALAQGIDKDPLDYSLKQWGYVLWFALLGGFASWVHKVRKGEIAKFAVAQLAGELVISAFSGLLCFLVCESLGFSKLLTIAMVGVFGHMGTRGIALLEAWGAKRFSVDFKESRDENADHR